MEKLVFLVVACWIAQLGWPMRLSLAVSFGLFLYKETVTRASVPGITPFYLASTILLWAAEVTAIFRPDFQMLLVLSGLLVAAIPVCTTRLTTRPMIMWLVATCALLSYYELYYNAMALIPLLYGFRKPSVIQTNHIACVGWTIWLLCPLGSSLHWVLQLGVEAFRLATYYTALTSQSCVTWYI